jgi:similar to spore coat protein
MEQRITPNETLQLHELLTFKNLCLTKSFTMSSLVTDIELKLILKHDVEITEGHIKELIGYMDQSNIAKTEGAEEKV